MTRFRALLDKELLDLMRNRGAFVPVILVTLISLVLPFALVVLVPGLTGHGFAGDADLARVSAIAGAPESLSENGRIQLFLFEQFLMLFLITPITGAMSLASHAIVGEKQARTLEPLLATPISTTELLIAKVLGALLPTAAISLAGFALYVGMLPLAAEPGVMAAMLTPRTGVLVLIVGPAAALVALQAAMIISSRANDARTAQQFGALIIVPLMAVLVAQFTGAIWLPAGALALIGVGLFAVWLLLAAVSVAIFDRESILTRWR
jgi:ABC-2 type transport system permease protein